MLKHFIRGIILAMMCCAYSTYSTSIMNKDFMNKVEYFVINSFMEIETILVKPKFIREWVCLPIKSYILEQLKNNVGEFIGSKNGIHLIAKALKNNLIDRQSIVTTVVGNFEVVDNFEKILKLRNGKFLIEIVLQDDPISVERIVLSAVKFPYKWKSIISFIERVGRKSPVRAQMIFFIKENYIEGKIANLPLPLFSCLCKLSPNDKSLKTKLKEDFCEYNLRGIIKKACYLQSLSEDKESSKLKLNFPTVKHIERYADDIAHSECALEYINGKSYFESMLDKVFQKEMELESNGYVAFKHAQMWYYGLLEKWFTSLWEVKKEKLVTNFLFLHVKSSLLKDHSVDYETGIREDLLERGSNYYTIKYTLCMNYMLFGNTNSTGSSSVWYAFNNFNNGNQYLSLANVFDCLDCRKIYKKYEKQLRELEQEYRKISQYGSMVVIGVPADRLVDSVYLGSYFGPEKGKLCIKGMGKTDDINTIIATLRNNPKKIENSDRVEFVLTMTQDKHGGLNPESGIKMYMFDAADPEKLETFRKKENMFLEQIKQEVRQQRDERSKNILAAEGYAAKHSTL